MSVLKDGAATLTRLREADSLKHELYVPDDDLGSKSEEASTAVRCLLLALVEQGFDLQCAAGHRAITSAVARIARSL